MNALEHPQRIVRVGGTYLGGRERVRGVDLEFCPAARVRYPVGLVEQCAGPLGVTVDRFDQRRLDARIPGDEREARHRRVSPRLGERYERTGEVTGVHRRDPMLHDDELSPPAVQREHSVQLSVILAEGFEASERLRRTPLHPQPDRPGDQPHARARRSVRTRRRVAHLRSVFVSAFVTARASAFVSALVTAEIVEQHAVRVTRKPRLEGAVAFELRENRRQPRRFDREPDRQEVAFEHLCHARMVTARDRAFERVSDLVERCAGGVCGRAGRLGIVECATSRHGVPPPPRLANRRELHRPSPH